MRPHPKSKATELEELIEIDTKFVPYDHTNTSTKKSTVADIVAAGTSEPTNLIRRMGGVIHEKLDQAKYSSQGYYELSEQ